MAAVRPRKRLAARRRITRSGRLPLWPILAALACLGGYWWGTTQAGGASGSSATGGSGAGASGPLSPNVPVPVAGTRKLASSLVVCVAIDESSSTDTTDPGGLRHDESEAIADWMARYSGNANDGFCAVRFSSAADGVGPVPASEGHTALAGLFGTSSPAVGGGTNLGIGVAELEKRMAPYGSSRRVAILITDGQLDDYQELGPALRKLRGAADSVYVIGLDGDGAWSSQTHSYYEGRGLTQLLTLGSVSNDALAETLARIILRETGQQVGTTRHSLAP